MPRSPAWSASAALLSTRPSARDCAGWTAFKGKGAIRILDSCLAALPPRGLRFQAVPTPLSGQHFSAYSGSFPHSFAPLRAGNDFYRRPSSRSGPSQLNDKAIRLPDHAPQAASYFVALTDPATTRCRRSMRPHCVMVAEDDVDRRRISATCSVTPLPTPMESEALCGFGSEHCTLSMSRWRAR